MRQNQSTCSSTQLGTVLPNNTYKMEPDAFTDIDGAVTICMSIKLLYKCVSVGEVKGSSNAFIGGKKL